MHKFRGDTSARDDSWIKLKDTYKKIAHLKCMRSNIEILPGFKMNNSREIAENLLDVFCEKYNTMIFSQIEILKEYQTNRFDESNEFVLFIAKNKDALLTALEGSENKDYLIRNLENIFFSQIYQHNQYIELPKNYHKKIKDLYELLTNTIITLLKKRSISNQILIMLSELLSEHYTLLLDTLVYFSKLMNEDDFNINIASDSVICSEYSAEFQIKLLGLDVANLKEPILDLGCGKHMNLVKFLKDLGYEVFGLDRNAVSKEDNLIASGWFDYKFKKNFWGTILSQMAFSNHFIFNHFYLYGKPELYAKLYMSILASLKVHGSFYYSPGLPFIEEHLPKENYQITRNKIDNLLEKKNQNFDDLYLYSVRIFKKLDLDV
jgi:hypothetical protein